MIYMVMTNGIKVMILETDNLKEIQKGRPAHSPDKSVLVAWTPDLPWCADRLQSLVRNAGEKGVDAVEVGRIIDDARTRTENPTSPRGSPEPAKEPPTVWRNRLVKVEDGTVMLSRVGQHDDFEFVGCESDPEGAWAARPPTGEGVVSVAAIDPERLLWVGEVCLWLVQGDIAQKGSVYILRPFAPDQKFDEWISKVDPDQAWTPERATYTNDQVHDLARSAWHDSRQLAIAACVFKCFNESRTVLKAGSADSVQHAQALRYAATKLAEME